MNEIFECKAFYIPRKVDYPASRDLNKGVDLTVVAAIQEAKNMGWTFYVVDTKRGRCCYRSKTITIPVFATIKGRTYKNWYICHEIAHIFAGAKADHGPIFMSFLKNLCPLDSIHHELGYKPQNAAAAGILASIDF